MDTPNSIDHFDHWIELGIVWSRKQLQNTKIVFSNFLASQLRCESSWEVKILSLSLSSNNHIYTNPLHCVNANDTLDWCIYSKPRDQSRHDTCHFSVHFSTTSLVINHSPMKRRVAALWRPPWIPYINRLMWIFRVLIFQTEGLMSPWCSVDRRIIFQTVWQEVRLLCDSILDIV